jgi:hypothetical protein
MESKHQGGIDINASISRIIMVCVQPPKYPAHNPKIVPVMAVTNTAAKPTIGKFWREDYTA